MAKIVKMKTSKPIDNPGTEKRVRKFTDDEMVMYVTALTAFIGPKYIFETESSSNFFNLRITAHVSRTPEKKMQEIYNIVAAAGLIKDVKMSKDFKDIYEMICNRFRKPFAELVVINHSGLCYQASVRRKDSHIEYDNNVMAKQYLIEFKVNVSLNYQE